MHLINMDGSQKFGVNVLNQVSMWAIALRQGGKRMRLNRLNRYDHSGAQQRESCSRHVNKIGEHPAIRGTAQRFEGGLFELAYALATETHHGRNFL